MASVPHLDVSAQPLTNDAAICAGAGLIVFLILGMAFLLRSLNLQLDMSPDPTGSPDQHMALGCLAVLIFLVGLALAVGDVL